MDTQLCARIAFTGGWLLGPIPLQSHCFQSNSLDFVRKWHNAFKSLTSTFFHLLSRCHYLALVSSSSGGVNRDDIQFDISVWTLLLAGGG